MNLVSNSIKFTQSGNVNVRVSARFQESKPDKAVIHISVEDEGIGMDELTQERVFEAFTQADTSTTREYGGTGLGLAISRHYIDLMGGDIIVQSALGKGTKITISIPLYVSSANQTGNGEDVPTPISARILSTNQPTYEMISSHLSILGIESSPLDEAELLPGDHWKHTICVVDYDSIEQTLEKWQKLVDGQILTGIVLTPLNGVVPPGSFKNWVTLTKPVTTKGLYIALDGVIESVTLADDERPVKQRRSKTERKHME